jgi:hypothetical protein
MAFRLAARLLIRVQQQCGPARYSARRPDPNRRAAVDMRALLYFAAVQRRKYPAKISIYRPGLWSYGDSNPRPLACHQHAGHPPEYIRAGHRPLTCRAGHQCPDTLLYFPAVLTSPCPPFLLISGRSAATLCATRPHPCGCHGLRARGVLVRARLQPAEAPRPESAVRPPD